MSVIDSKTHLHKSRKTEGEASISYILNTFTFGPSYELHNMIRRHMCCIPRKEKRDVAKN